MGLAALIPLIVIWGTMAIWIWYSNRRAAVLRQVFRQLRTLNPLCQADLIDFQDKSMGSASGSAGWQASGLVISAEGITLYPVSIKVQPVSIKIGSPLVIPLTGLRWFGRPEKYHNGRNQLWLHVDQDGKWRLIKLRAWPRAIQTLVRTLKGYATPDLVKAYRRSRPYIHSRPVIARPAEQDIYGAWTLRDPVTLYVMPLYVVLLDIHTHCVLRLLPLADIQQISAMRRLDDPKAAGLVSFEVNGEKLAFAMDNYRKVATAISEAARRGLEEPVERKKKKRQ